MAYQPVPVTFPVGTLIVPMDATYQDNGMYKAYGLIFRLLYENIINTDPNYEPIYVYWAIDPNKTAFTTVDFTATTRGYNTADGPAARAYSGGPFIIQSDDLAYAKTLIDAWITANTDPDPDPKKNTVVTIHELVNQATINTIAKLIRPPRISVEDNNNGIVRDYLDAAGLPDYYALSGTYTTVPEWTSNNISILDEDEIANGAFFGNTYQTTCQKLAYDIFISPHTSEGVWIDNPNTLPNLDEFIRLGGILHSMCESIPSIEDNALFLTTSGIIDENKGDDFFINTSEATNPLLQAVPTDDPQDLPGGSVQTWENSLTSYKPLTDVLAYFIENSIQYDLMVAGQYQGSIFDPNANGSGAIVYQGGHSYETKIPYTDDQEDMYTKFVLNSVFLSVTKPFIDLTINPNAIVADGNPKNLTFTIKNIGGAQAKNATISVTLLSGMTPSNFSIAPTSIIGDTLTWSNITLDGGDTITFDVLNYTPISPGAFAIDFTATYSDEIFATDQNPYILDTCTTLAVLPANSPFLLVEKEVDGSTQTFIEPGGTVVFTYTITNFGDQPAYDIELVDPNLFDYFDSTSFIITTTPITTPPLPPPTIDTINKKIIFQPGLLGLSIPAGPPPVLGNPLIVTVNATHKGSIVVPPETIINEATINYVNLFDPQQPVSLTSPESNSATTKIVLPDILVEKSVDKANAAIGDILKYTIDITNPGNTTITQVDITDLIPTGSSYVPDSLNVTTNISPPPTITANYIATPPARVEVTVIGELDPIPPDPDTPTETITIEFEVQVNSIPPNPTPNHATVDYIYKIGEQSTGTESEDSNTVETNIASLQVVKTAPPFVELGENLTYTISLTNNGEVPLTNVQLIDTIPPGTSFVSVTGATFISQVGQIITLQVASIPINSTVTVTITVKVNTLPPDPYEITNFISAIFTVDGDEKPPVIDTATSTVVEGKIDVIKGTVGNISNAKVGDTVTYEVEITNTGNVPVTLTNLNDIIQPPGYTNPNTTNMPLNITLQPQQSTTITYDVDITAVPPGLNPKIDNTVTIDFNYQVGQQTVTGQEQDSYTVNIQTPDISVVKDVDKQNAAVGDILTYTVEITNTGTVNIDTVTFTDLIPTGTSYVANSLNVTTNIIPAPTISKQYIAIPPERVEVIVNGQFKPLNKITITFKVKVESITQNPITNQGTVDFIYRVDPNEPPRTETRDSNIVETNVASLIITKSAPQFVELGENLIYTISITNNGQVDLTNVQINDTIPNETSFVNATVVGATKVSQQVIGKNVTIVVNPVPIGATVDINIEVSVDTLPPAPYEIKNSATAIYTVDGDPKPPVESEEVTTIVQEGKIDVNKGTMGDITYAKVGDTVTYEVEITNTGNVPVTLTNLNDTIQPPGYTSPDITNIPLNTTLQPNESITITYDVDITSLPPDKKLDNTVTVDFNYQIGQETKTGQAEDTFTLNVEEIKVSLTKAVNKLFAEPGEELTYTFTINNQSSVPITNVYLYDPLPANTTFVQGSFSLDPTQNPTVFPGAFIGTIPSNSQVVASFKVRIDPDLTSAVNIPNEGSVTYNFKLDPNEPGPGQPAGPENSNVVNTQVEIAEIKLTKSVSDEFAEVGDIITYTVTVENTGTVDAHDVEVIDILSSDLQFVPGTLVVTPQQIGDTVTGTNPSYVKISIVRANPNVVTIQFDAEVISRPQSGKIDNIAHANFKYSLDPQLPPTLSKTDIPSNVVTTTVQEIEVEILKTSNKTFVEVGQNLTYTVQITNKSTVPVDIKFTDTLPAVTQYVTGSFNLISGSATVTNNTVPDSTLIDVDITGMSPQSSVIFSYKVKILSLPPSPSEITNAAVAIPSYSLFPGGPIREGNPVTDEVTTPVKLIKIEAIKSVEEAVATIGDILHYTVTIINNGNVTAENVVFSDNVPDGTEFVEGSLTVDGVQVDSSPEEGVDIGSIVPGQIVTIKFNVKVVAIPEPPNEPKAENTALVTFDVELDGQLQPRDPVTSNPVETELVKVQLEAIKTVDKDMANVGDILTYTVVIKNTGDITIDNVIFNDIIPEGTVLVGSQPVQNVNLGSIEPGESKTITFQVKIVSKPCPPKLINKATINGTYIIETQRKISIESNEVITYVDVRMFKQFSVDENLIIPSQKPDMEEILEVIVDVEITYTNLIKTSIITSYEGQTLTGWKLIVEGKLKQKIVYIADEPTQSVHAAEFDVPFSTFIVLPADYKKCIQLKVEGIVEDVFVRLIDKRRIFKNVTLIVEAKKVC
ncbi:DUF7507 domain-containing protein [Clostridium ganghwense]|uniref:DUF3794 domain-containing protein n=1 Tax=Clostridium ganghwense TaxID=312089 RepID=A0ABT4CNG6_9CLOT|nr:SPOCS domain-containing protein [Clostridium ganghwense]MCY6369539.1 DUF3794 domain-containing protein [Clostridium ganghwense]